MLHNRSNNSDGTLLVSKNHRKISGQEIPVKFFRSASEGLTRIFYIMPPFFDFFLPFFFAGIRFLTGFARLSEVA